MTWPTRKPMAWAFPARTSATASGFAATTSRTAAASAPSSLIRWNPASLRRSSDRLPCAHVPSQHLLGVRARELGRPRRGARAPRALAPRRSPRHPVSVSPLGQPKDLAGDPVRDALGGQGGVGRERGLERASRRPASATSTLASYAERPKPSSIARSARRGQLGQPRPGSRSSQAGSMRSGGRSGSGK